MSAVQILGSIAIAYVFLYASILAHELGHLMAARLAGARVAGYSIGDGPLVLTFIDEFGAAWMFRPIPNRG